MTKKVRWTLSILFIGFIVLGITVALISIFINAGKSSNPSFSIGKKVGLVHLKGAIKDSENMVQQLKSMRVNSSVAAVVLRINSPGGGIAASQEIYEEVKKFDAVEKPIIVSMSSVAASGGYYVACPAHMIFANPGTVTGSIGVIFQMPYTAELFKKIGIGTRVFKSGEFKDTGNMLRKLTPQEKKLIQGVVDDGYMQFVEAIVEGRDLTREAVMEIADGRIFTGRQALEAGLVDSLGTLEDAIAYAGKVGEIAGVPGIVEPRIAKRSLWQEYLFDNLAGLLKGLGFAPNEQRAMLRYEMVY